MGFAPRHQSATPRRRTPWTAVAWVAVCAILASWMPRAEAQPDAEEIQRIVKEIRIAYAKTEMARVKSLVEELQRLDPQHPNLPLYLQMARYDPSKAGSGPFALPKLPQTTATPQPSPTPSATPRLAATTVPAQSNAQSLPEPEKKPKPSVPMFVLGALLILVPVALVILLVRRASQQAAPPEEKEAPQTATYVEAVHEMHPEPEPEPDEKPAQPGIVPMPNTDSPEDYEPTPSPPTQHMASAPPSEPSFEAFDPIEEEQRETAESPLPEEQSPVDEEPLVLFEEEAETLPNEATPTPEEPRPEASGNVETGDEPLEIDRPVARPDERPPKQIMPERVEEPSSVLSREPAKPPQVEPQIDEEALDLSAAIEENAPPKPAARQSMIRPARDVFPESPDSPFLTDEDTHDHLEHSTSPFHSDEETVVHVPERHDTPAASASAEDDAPKPQEDDRPRFRFSSDEETQISHLADSTSADETFKENE